MYGDEMHNFNYVKIRQCKAMGPAYLFLPVLLLSASQVSYRQCKAMGPAYLFLHILYSSQHPRVHLLRVLTLGEP